MTLDYDASGPAADAMRKATTQLQQKLKSTGRVIQETTEGEYFDRILDISEQVYKAVVENGRQLFTCGNGGSAAQALHFAEEMLGRYKADRPPLQACCLSSDPTVLTCIANDYDFADVFSRQIEALGQVDDVLVCLSTSGNSPNILSALKTGQSKALRCIALLGNGGGLAATLASSSLIVPSTASDVIQECHLVAIHSILEYIEARLSA